MTASHPTPQNFVFSFYIFSTLYTLSSDYMVIGTRRESLVKSRPSWVSPHGPLLFTFFFFFKKIQVITLVWNASNRVGCLASELQEICPCLPPPGWNYNHTLTCLTFVYGIWVSNPGSCAHKVNIWLTKQSLVPWVSFTHV